MLVLISVPLSSLAQSDQERFERQMEQLRLESIWGAPAGVPAGQRMLVDYGGYAVFDYLTLEDNAEDTHVLRQYSLLGYFRLNIDAAQEVFVRARAVYRDFHSGDSFDGRGDELLDPDFDRAYYRFNLAGFKAEREGEVITDNLILQAGRDLVYWANGLTMAQVIDGGRIEFSAGRAAGSFIAGVTPVRTVDVDSSRPDFDFNTRRGFFGGLLSYQLGAHRPFVYGLIQRDYNKDEVLTTGPVTTEFEYDSRYLGVGSTGNFGDRILYAFEAVHQTGETLSNSFRVDNGLLSDVPQTRDDIDAYAASLRVDYLFKDDRRSRISGEFLLASGDDDRFNHTANTFGGNARGTADRAYNAFGLVNTGLALAPAVSNLVMLRVGGSTFPFTDSTQFRRLQTGLDVFFFGKMDRDAPIDEPTNDHRFIGWEPDVFLNWQMTSDLSVAVRYGIVFLDEDTFTIDDARQFFSVTLTFAF